MNMPITKQEIRKAKNMMAEEYRELHYAMEKLQKDWKEMWDAPYAKQIRAEQQKECAAFNKKQKKGMGLVWEHRSLSNLGKYVGHMWGVGYYERFDVHTTYKANDGTGVCTFNYPDDARKYAAKYLAKQELTALQKKDEEIAELKRQLSAVTVLRMLADKAKKEK
jgi:hypothetical protein